MNSESVWGRYWCLCICLIGSVATIAAEPRMFDDYMFAQEWPATVCTYSNLGEGCQIPDNVTGWTIHGLWPSCNGGFGPEYCNNSWPLTTSSIYDLEDKLRAQWKSFAGDSFSFWSYEWLKHGTCASAMSQVADPHKYFGKALELNKKYDLLAAYSSVGIDPSNTEGHTYEEIIGASWKLFNTSVTIKCSYDEYEKKQYLAQVELCLDLQFMPTCDHRHGDKQRLRIPSVKDCWRDQNIYYPKHQH